MPITKEDKSSDASEKPVLDAIKCWYVSFRFHNNREKMKILDTNELYNIKGMEQNKIITHTHTKGTIMKQGG